MRKARRVRFVHSETDEFPDNGPNTSSGEGEAARPRVLDAPKTSEYAFFKKIKKDAGHSYCSLQPQVNNQLKSGKSHNHKEPDTKFSFLAEEEGAAKQKLFLSPQMGTPVKVKQRSSRLNGNVASLDQNVFFSPVGSASVNSGNQHFGKGVFAQKRQELHQMAADTMLLGNEKNCSEGFDLVSLLLARLLTKGSENDDLKPVEGKIHSNDQLPALPVPHACRKRSRELQNGSSWRGSVPRYSSSNAKNVIFSEPDHPLAVYDAKPNFHDEMASYNYVSYPKYVRSECRRSDSPFRLSYERYGLTGSLHVQELFEDYDPSEASRRVPHNLLLEWGFNGHKEKPMFYPFASGTEKHMQSTLRTSRDVHHLQIADIELDEGAFSGLSFFPQYASEYNLFPHFHPTRLHSWDMRRGLEYDNSMHLGMGQFSSRLSFTPKYLTQAEEYDTSDVFKSSNTILPGQDHPLSSNVLGEQRQHDFDALLLPRGPDVDLDWKCLSVTNLPRLRELPASHAFQFPMKREIYPYYLNKEEQEYSLLSSLSGGNSVSFSSYQDYSFTNTFKRAMCQPMLLDNSSWNESYLLEDDYK